MTRLLDTLLSAGLALSLIGAIGQLVIMILDIFVMPDLRWYWGGSIAFFVAPVAFAVTRRLLDTRLPDTTDA